MGQSFRRRTIARRVHSAPTSPAQRGDYALECGSATHRCCQHELSARLGQNAFAFEGLASEKRLFSAVSRTDKPGPERWTPECVAVALADWGCVYGGRRCLLRLLVFSRQLAPSFSPALLGRGLPVTTAMRWSRRWGR